MLFVLPAFTPWLSHGTIHALHDHQAKHHSANSHQHGHEGHEHHASNTQKVHHPIELNAVTYFSDYLHVDLQSPKQITLQAPSLDADPIDCTLAYSAQPVFQPELFPLESRAPPDMRRVRLDKTPLYLSTQRLRI